MLRKLALAVAMLVSFAAMAAPAHDWRPHLNARFGTGAEIPVDVFGKSFESENGDGMTWESADGAKLLVFGFWNSNDDTPASYEASVKGAEGARTVTYRVANKRLLILSGTKKDKIFYERYAFGDPSGAVHALVLEYPRSARATFDPIVERLSKSLHWAGPGKPKNR